VLEQHAQGYGVMRKLPPLNSVRAFEAAARHVSFTKAADELHVTPGAISRQVAILEEWFGRPLFRRTASQLVLTEVGRAYLAEVTAALDRIAVASTYMLEQVAPVALRVSVPPTFTMRWLIARLSRFQRQRPEAELRLSTSIAPVTFHDNLYDVAIRGAQEPPTDCASVRFMSELILPVCHPDLMERGALATPSDFMRHTVLSYVTEPYEWSSWFDAVGVPGLKPAGSLKFEQMYFALQAACEGLGVALVPLFLVVDDIIVGKLSAPFGVLGAKRRDYYASFSKESDSSLLVSAFCEWLQQEGSDTERSMHELHPESGWADQHDDATSIAQVSVGSGGRSKTREF
jgi:LysR family glycine cleavage system transcriptional activator